MSNKQTPRSANHPAGKRREGLVMVGGGGMVQPAPLKAAADVVTLADGRKMVWLCFETVHGSMQYLMDAELAAGVGNRLLECSTNAKSKLITPSPGLVVP